MNKSLFETTQQILVGLLISAIYGLIQGDINIGNILIVLFTIKPVYIFNLLKEKPEK